MPLNYARRLTGRDRTLLANQHLGCVLAFVAGAANAGGFVAVRRYTSHMTGIVSAVADDLVLGDLALALDGLGALLCFACGAACSAVMINFARRRRLHSEYAMPLLLEAALLIGFGLLGARLSRVEGLFVPATVMLLCFIMGLQNAVITKLSQAEIRTTHLTGMVTDVGIEIGKLLYWNRSARPDLPAVRANVPRLRALVLLVGFFFAGGVIGALGFKHAGYVATIPLALLLVAIASIPAMDDLAALSSSK
ncbi:YoaK family protein [Pelomonas sp. KK5]|uniref:YoaK family protein n=1 Tax=Pelomonas sp. KK5 TaxID=1855730 RepID=UPI00097C5D2A|nr:YoaK family protein [Pelomonas sp. KK5]